MKTLWSKYNRWRSAGMRLWTVAMVLGLALLGAHVASAESGSTNKPNVYRTANFQVNYRSEANQGSCDPQAGDFQPWPADAQAAMNHVINILDDLFNSTPLIVVDACYQVAADPTTLASASPTTFVTQDEVSPGIPTANRLYAIALANALTGADQNGDQEVEIVAEANSAIEWDFCTTGCTVDANRNDFVSTMIHELLHGLGYFTSFEPEPTNGNPPPAPTFAFYSDPPNVMDDFVIRVLDSVKLIDLPNNSAELLNATQQGSGTVGYNGQNTLAINGNSTPFIYSPTTYSQGSSMSHWDDDHATNLGRMMNSATGAGPSSRVVDAITLMSMKDIGWSLLDPRDHGNATHAAYGDAQHINHPSFFGHLKLGNDFSTENAPSDTVDDGVTQVGTWQAGANGGTVAVTVVSSEPSTLGCLSAWIDWERNNDFAGPSETLTNMRPVIVGNQNVMFDVPAFVAGNDPSTQYNARFRLIPDWDGDGACIDQVS